MFRYVVFPVLSIFLLSGCASNPGVFYWSDYIKNFGEANYAQIVQDFDASGESFNSLQPGDLFAVCGAYVKVNNFDQAFDCLALYRASVRVGEFNFTGIGDSRAFERIWFGQAKLAIGDTTSALEAADAAEQIRVRAGNEYFHTKVLEIEVASLRGSAYLLQEDHAAVNKQIVLLEAISTEGLTSMLLTTQKHQVLASLKFGLGEYQAALADSRQRKGLLMRGWDDGVLRQFALPSLYIEARALLETQNIDAARQKYDELLGSGRIAEVGRIYWVALTDRARIAKLDGEPRRSIDYLQTAIEVIESQRKTIGTEASRIGFAGNTQAVYSQLVKELVESNESASAFEYVERGKARALVDVLATKQTFARRGASAETVSQLLSSIDQEDKRSAMAAYVPRGAQQHSNQRAVRSAKALQELKQIAPEVAELVSVVPSQLREIQGQLSEAEVLVEFFGSDAELFIFVVSSVNINVKTVPIARLDENIRWFRDAITAQEEDDVAELADVIYRQLFGSIESLLTTRVVIVPHGPLHYLPFNALRDKSDFLVESRNIRVLPSASVLKYLGSDPSNSSYEILAMGNPDLGNRDMDLPGAEREVNDIASMFSQTRLLLRGQASETNLKQLGHKFPYLHFAMHGTFDAATPLSSGLLMSGDDQNDGVLTVAELYDLDLPAELVTLSACETGMGTVSSGDDVIGFTRGFLFAGTQTIISSLWKVDDAATYYLMNQFYQYLPDHSKQAALRLAQIDTRKNYGDSPYYWAAFQLNGSGD